MIEPLAQGQIIDKKYRLEGEGPLGTGGYGAVWKASGVFEDKKWKVFALKILDVPVGESARVNDWLHEVSLLQGIEKCDAIPAIHNVGLDNGRPYIAMELLEGETLEDRLQRSPLHWRKALAIAKAVATALDACHGKKVIHCDLKPSNVFLERTGKCRVLVLDFGAATLSGEKQAHRQSKSGDAAGVTAEVPETARVSGPVSSQGQPDRRVENASSSAPAVVGTLGYISPERLCDRPPDAVSDAFSLGVLLYHSIAGRLPQKVEALTAEQMAKLTKDQVEEVEKRRLVDATINREFVPLGEVVSRLPPGIISLVSMLLGPEEERPAAGKLVETIEKVWRRPYGIPNQPFAGLASLGIERAPYLAGRKATVDAIMERLHNERGLVLMGPSGMGKSSLAASGVAARIDEEMLDNTEGWVCRVVRPSDRANGLRGDDASGAIGTLPRHLGTLVVVDQLEEIFGLPSEERRAFASAFQDLVLQRAAVVVENQRIDLNAPVRVLVTVRGDLYDAVARLPELYEGGFLTKHLYVVRDVDPNELEQLVTLPLQDVGYGLEEADGVDVVADVVREVRADGAALPLVQFALARLWQKRDAGQKALPAAEWAALGGIQGALGNAAEAVFKSFEKDAQKQKAMKTACLALFNERGTRALVVEDAVEPAVRDVLQRLRDEEIVRRGVDAQGRAVFDVVHEALGKNWARFEGWRVERDAQHAMQREAEAAAQQWAKHGRSVDLVWRGALLANNLDTLRKLEEEPTKAFVEASMAEAERARGEAEAVRMAAAQAQQRKFWIERVLLPSALVLVALVASIGWVTTSRAKSIADAAGAQLEITNEELTTKNADLIRKKREAEDATNNLLILDAMVMNELDKAEETRDKAIDAKKKLDEQISQNDQCRSILKKTAANIFNGPL